MVIYSQCLGTKKALINMTSYKSPIKFINSNLKMILEYCFYIIIKEYLNIKSRYYFDL